MVYYAPDCDKLQLHQGNEKFLCCLRKWNKNRKELSQDALNGTYLI